MVALNAARSSRGSGVTSIGQGGQSPPRFSGVNITLIGGVASVQEFRRFARVSASLLPNPSYAPEGRSQDYSKGGAEILKQGKAHKLDHMIVVYKC